MYLKYKEHDTLQVVTRTERREMMTVSGYQEPLHRLAQ